MAQSSEDILNDALSFLGGNPVVDDEVISYGPLRLTVAPKVGTIFLSVFLSDLCL